MAPFIHPTELPYLGFLPNDGRRIPLLGFYDNDRGQFCAYSLQPGNRVLVLPDTLLREGTYISKEAAQPEVDYRLLMTEELIQHFSYEEILKVYRAIEEDIINGLTTLHQYFVLLYFSNANNDLSDHLMIKILVEYAFGNHRAFYDLLNDLICVIHKMFEKRAPNLSNKNSFEKFTTMEASDLEGKYFFPQPIVEFYKNREDKFLKLRYVRNNIYHHGHSPDHSFKFDDGFAFRVDDRFAAKLGDLQIWPENLLKPNRLGSVLAILECLVSDMLNAADQLAVTLPICFQTEIQQIAPGYQIFLRSSVGKHIKCLEEYRQKHWFDPAKILGL